MRYYIKSVKGGYVIYKKIRIFKKYYRRIDGKIYIMDLDYARYKLEELNSGRQFII